MPFVQFITGGTFGPGMTFKDDIYFESCTFLAQCKFGERCFFINCKFQKCCPKHYRNQNSVMKEGCFLKGCTLEYVTVPKGCVLYQCKNTGNRVQIQGTQDPKNQQYGGNGESTKPITQFNDFDSQQFNPDINGPTKETYDKIRGYNKGSSAKASRSWK